MDQVRGGAKRHFRMALSLACVALFMVGLSFAAVPLYRVFCQVTGYAGTTQRAERGADRVLARAISVRFDANARRNLGWSFKPIQRTLDVKIGETQLVFYRVENHSTAPATGTATFNVTPEIAGSYFNKIECFCFSEQTLAAGQKMEMPVIFFIDPGIVDDPDASRITDITLSYTFFPVDRPSQGLVQDKTDESARAKGT